MLVVVAVAVFYLTGGFAFYCFSTSSFTLPWAIAEFLHSFYTFSPAHRRVICDTFNLTFLGYLSDTVLSGHFLSTGATYPTLLRLWLRCGQEHPIQDLPLCLPSQSSPFQLTHGLELLMFELQDHWFINCASEPRSIELKLSYCICFACPKSYIKTIKKLFEQDLYCLKLLINYSISNGYEMFIRLKYLFSSK